LSPTVISTTRIPA